MSVHVSSSYSKRTTRCDVKLPQNALSRPRRDFVLRRYKAVQFVLLANLKARDRDPTTGVIHERSQEDEQGRAIKEETADGILERQGSWLDLFTPSSRPQVLLPPLSSSSFYGLASPSSSCQFFTCKSFCTLQLRCGQRRFAFRLVRWCC